MADLPDYMRIDEALSHTDSDFNGAAAHGLLCGMVVAKREVELGSWLLKVLAECDSADASVKQAGVAVADLFEVTLSQLNDCTAGFYVFLPDDDSQGLLQRTSALGSWLRAFSLGLVEGGLKQETELPDDTADLLRDFQEFARLELITSDEVDEGREIGRAHV